MHEVAKALNAFYSQFELEAYADGSVPVSAELPYITYTVSESGLFSGAAHRCRVWYPGTGYAGVSLKADEITKSIGQGKKIDTESGFILLYPGEPLCQIQPTDDETRVISINLIIRCYGKR